jgi:hypothetical protein
MVDPVTVGSLVAGALSMTAEAVLKGTVGEAVKDGYKALKEKVSHWASGEVTALEADAQLNWPTNGHRRNHQRPIGGGSKIASRLG